ncbi:MAG TPA: LysM domain-containing protein [Chitinispirillaceae bacterium]|nr:LysM domain-containing protein [Chitinispirillaceae bacterium]
MNNPFDKKLPDANKIANDQTSKAQGLSEGKLNDTKGFGEGKMNDTKGFGEGKLNDTKGFGNSFSSPAGNKGAGVDNASSFSNKGGENKISGTQSSGISGQASSGISNNRDSSSLSNDTIQNKKSPMSGSNKPAAGSSGQQVTAGSSAATGTSAAPKSTGTNAKNSKPKTYIVKPGEDLGIIAKKFRMPSWKYLYQLNKDKIGDNPDLLKEGTELTIPQWDSTQGDELIREKGGNPMACTGGLQYRYPWVPFSVTLADGDGNQLEDSEDGYKIVVTDSKTKNEILSKVFKKADEITVLIPDSPELNVTIERNSEEK